MNNDNIVGVGRGSKIINGKMIGTPSLTKEVIGLDFIPEILTI